MGTRPYNRATFLTEAENAASEAEVSRIDVIISELIRRVLASGGDSE